MYRVVSLGHPCCLFLSLSQFYSREGYEMQNRFIQQHSDGLQFSIYSLPYPHILLCA